MRLMRACVVIEMAVLGGCESPSSPRGTVQYTPLYSPVSITWDSDGEVSIVGAKRLVTAIGVFDLGSAIDVVPADKGLLVVLRDQRTGTEKAYRVRSDEDFTVEHPDGIVIRDGRVIIDISDGNPNSIRFGEGPHLAPSQTSSHSSLSRNLSGWWTSSHGDLMYLQDEDQQITLQVMESRQMAWGLGRLTRRSGQLRGDFQAVFFSDPVRLKRQSPLRAESLDDNTLRAFADEITWDSRGIEVTRIERPFILSRER